MRARAEFEVEMHLQAMFTVGGDQWRLMWILSIWLLIKFSEYHLNYSLDLSQDRFQPCFDSFECHLNIFWDLKYITNVSWKTQIKQGSSMFWLFECHLSIPWDQYNLMYW